MTALVQNNPNRKRKPDQRARALYWLAERQYFHRSWEGLPAGTLIRKHLHDIIRTTELSSTRKLPQSLIVVMGRQTCLTRWLLTMATGPAQQGLRWLGTGRARRAGLCLFSLQDGRLANCDVNHDTKSSRPMLFD